MFDISTTLATGASLISAYGQGGFTVAGVRYEGAIVINGASVTPLGSTSVDALDSAALEAVMAYLQPIPEILLIGTGISHRFIPPAMRQAYKRTHNSAVDSMDTGAACRTFNILITEGRHVGALLLPVGT